MVIDIVNTILTGVQIATLIALIVYVIKTWEMSSATKDYAKTSQKTLNEIKETRDQEIAPYVVSYFDFDQHDIYLVVKNIGKGLATNVSLKFDPELKSSRTNFNEFSLIKNGIPSLPPNYEIKTFFDTSPEYLDSGLPLIYNVKISYSGGISNKPRLMEYSLDLEFYHDIRFLGKNDMNDLVKEIEKIRKIQEQILENNSK